VTRGKLAGQLQDVVVSERGSLQVEKTGPGIANLLAEVATGTQHAQHTSIVKVIRGHCALLCT
jgi:hypothetical protein